MLKKMLAEQHPPPMTLLDMYSERLKDVIVSTYPDPPFERSISHRSLLISSNLSPITKILLPSLLPWCRQCDRHGHIDYATIPCGRCAGNHQTSACPITIMGMCVYCTALGLHFSQLCPQRKYIPYCPKCGTSGHTENHCNVLPSRIVRSDIRTLGIWRKPPVLNVTKKDILVDVVQKNNVRIVRDMVIHLKIAMYLPGFDYC